MPTLYRVRSFRRPLAGVCLSIAEKTPCCSGSVRISRSGFPFDPAGSVRVFARLDEAGHLMGVPVHDHLIGTHEGCTSLAERGLMG